jgi:hypothetical protein
MSQEHENSRYFGKKPASVAVDCKPRHSQTSHLAKGEKFSDYDRLQGVQARWTGYIPDHSIGNSRFRLVRILVIPNAIAPAESEVRVRYVSPDVKRALGGLPLFTVGAAGVFMTEMGTIRVICEVDCPELRETCGFGLCGRLAEG